MYFFLDRFFVYFSKIRIFLLTRKYQCFPGLSGRLQTSLQPQYIYQTRKQSSHNITQRQKNDIQNLCNNTPVIYEDTDNIHRGHSSNNYLSPPAAEAVG